MLVEHLLQGLGEIAQEMKPIGDLLGARGSAACPFGVHACPIAAQHAYTRMRAQPLGECVSGPIGQERDRSPTFQIDSYCAIALVLTLRPIIHAQDSRRWTGGHGALPECTQHCLTTHALSQGCAQARAGSPSSRKTNANEARDQPVGPPLMGWGDLGEAFTKDVLGAAPIVTVKSPHLQM
jgi:hypothetical protein